MKRTSPGRLQGSLPGSGVGIKSSISTCFIFFYTCSMLFCLQLLIKQCDLNSDILLFEVTLCASSSIRVCTLYRTQSLEVCSGQTTGVAFRRRTHACEIGQSSL